MKDNIDLKKVKREQVKKIKRAIESVLEGKEEYNIDKKYEINFKKNG